MTTAQIIQELRHIRKDLAGTMKRMDRIEPKLVFIAGLVEIRVLERDNDAVQGSGEGRKEYVA